MTRAPAAHRRLTLPAEARSRVSSTICPEARGTLRSARTKTRRPRTGIGADSSWESQSSSVVNSKGGPLLHRVVAGGGLPGHDRNDAAV